MRRLYNPMAGWATTGRLSWHGDYGSRSSVIKSGRLLSNSSARSRHHAWPDRAHRRHGVPTRRHQSVKESGLGRWQCRCVVTLQSAACAPTIRQRNRLHLLPRTAAAVQAPAVSVFGGTTTNSSPP